MGTQVVKGIAFPAGIRDLKAYANLLRADVRYMEATADRRERYKDELQMKKQTLTKVEAAL